MHLQVNKFASAAAVTMGVLYTFCALFVVVWPDLSSQLMSWLLHLVAIEPSEVTWVNFIGGLVQAIIYTYIGAWLLAWLHNKFVKA